MSDDAERQIQLMLATAMAGPEAVRLFRELTVEGQLAFMTDLYDRLTVDGLRKVRNIWWNTVSTRRPPPLST